MDLSRVNVVVNLDLPKDAESYLHRIGRTGRFGTYGIAVNIITDDEKKWLEECRQKSSQELKPLPDHIDPSEYIDELETEEEV